MPHQLLCASALFAAGFIAPPAAWSHCDTMDRPVIQSARTALQQKDVTPVLKWVKKDDVEEIRSAFTKALVVRSGGVEARELADQFFMETLVRVHRAGEGAPYTGLKPAGAKVSPAIAEADKALETGSVEKVLKLMTDEAAVGIQQRFNNVREAAKHAEQTVEAGRAFVAAYVDYVHYIEGLHQALQGAQAHAEQPADGKRGAHAHAD